MDNAQYNAMKKQKEQEEKKKDSRPYSSPNYPKEEENTQGFKKEYTEKNKERIQQATEKASTITQNMTNVLGNTTPTPSPTNNSNQSSSHQTQQQEQQNQQYQNTVKFFNALATPSNSISMNSTQLLNNANTSRIFNISTTTKMLGVQYKQKKKELRKAIEQQEKEEKEERAKPLKELANGLWRDGEKKSVRYATSIDYYNMEKAGYETVYVEKGTGKLEDKSKGSGLWTIGRDRIAGLPADVDTILVNKQGEWLYLADTGDHATWVETLRTQQEALDALYEDKITHQLAVTDTAKAKRDALKNSISYYDKMWDKYHREEDLSNLNAALQAYNALTQVVNNGADTLTQYGKEWADKYEYYDIAIRSHTKWTVEDEAKYQDLKNRMLAGTVGDPTVISSYIEMNKRREANMNCAAFLDTDYIEKLKKDTENIKKAVEDYNKWDDTMIHAENGEDIGIQAKRMLALNLGYDSLDNPLDMALTTIRDIRMLKSGGVGLLFNIFDKEYREEAADILSATGDALKKHVTPIIVAHQEVNKAQEAYKNITELIDSGQYRGDDLAALYAKRNDYITAQHNAASQVKSIMMNNLVSDMSVFDIFSVQNAYVAWQMAKHPERYSDDPKWKKMQEFYEAIYGTAWRTDMDAGKMAKAIIDNNLGKAGNDFIYLDGSDLRHANNEKYGFWASMAVSMLTDISFLFSVGKGAASATTKLIGARTLANTVSDSIIQAMVRSNVKQEAAKQFVKSDYVQKTLRRDIKASIRTSMENGGADLLTSVQDAMHNRVKYFGGMFVDDVTKNLDNLRYADFLRYSDEMLANSGSLSKRSLLVEKGTMLTSALGNIDDALNEAQLVLFQTTCPAAGAVVGIAKVNKYIKGLKNLPATSEESLSRLVVTGTQAQARIAEVGFDSCLDGVGFRQKAKAIIDEFAQGVEGSLKKARDMAVKTGENADNIESIVKAFSDYKDQVMHGVANSYVSRVVNDLHTAFKGKGLDGLEELAAKFEYSSFDEMYNTIKENLTVMYEFSAEAEGIVKAFDTIYDNALVQRSISQAKDYVFQIEQHAIDIESAMTYFTPTNAAGLQGLYKSIKENIHDFLYTADNDYTMFITEAGERMTIHEFGVKAMDALEDVALGNVSDEAIAAAQEAVNEYLDVVNNVYLKNAQDWEANVIQDALGAQHYLDNINHIVPEHAGNTQVLNQVTDSVQKYFESKGIDISKEDIVSRIVKENPNEFMQMDMYQRQSVIYRVMENKGSNVIGQISDADLRVITDELVDCNSQFNKNLRLLQLELNNEAAEEYVTRAITNACAIDHSRILYETMKEGGVDSTLSMAVMDVMAGKANYINSIVQSYPADIATAKVRDFITHEVSKQLALHHGSYSLFSELGCNTVDVALNIKNIEANIDKYIPEDPDCIDVCISMVRSTDSSAPKDIAFHVRGSADEATVLRKAGNFTVYDDGFANRTFGRTAQQLTDDYTRVLDKQEISTDEWIRQVQDYINRQKQFALENNKTLRFIGFNSSDAISGGNKYISDVLRSCGVNANTANAMDLADVIRSTRKEYVFDSAQLETLTRGLRSAIDMANSRGISNDISKAIAYDPKYTCADMINYAFKDIAFNNEALDTEVKYILDRTETVHKALGTEAYNELGLAMGTYIDATEFAKVLQDAGESTVHANGDLMRLISEATAQGEPQLGLHKIIQTTMDEQWIDPNKLNSIGKFETAARIHESILQINKINEGIHRLDIITEADRPNLEYIFKDILNHTGLYHSNNLAYTVARAMKVEELTTQQLYSATKWLLDNVRDVLKPDKYDTMFGIMLLNAPEQVTKLSDVGYKFIRDNIVDYTNDTIDAFFVKFLDKSEEGYKFSQALNELAELNRKGQSLKNYTECVNGLYAKYNIHGAQDKLLIQQMAAIHSPIIEFQDEVKAIYERVYEDTRRELYEEAKQFASKGRPVPRYSEDMVHRIATERGVKEAKRYVAQLGDETRAYAVKAVANLNEEAFKAHLIRNCCGAMVIDPTAKAVQGIDLVTLFEQWKSYGVQIDAIDFSMGTIQNRKLFRVSLPELNGADMDEVFAKYNHARVSFENPVASSFNPSLSRSMFEESGMRNASFGASDMTLVNPKHIDTFRELFFSDGSATVLDLNKNFSPWTNELYSCNMWTDMDIKQLVNPYYTDNILNNLAQNTHQLRNNITAVHDLGTIMNNHYMNTKYILQSSGVLTDAPISVQRSTIVKQIRDQKQHLCRLSFENNKFKIIDYTPRLLKQSTDDRFFEEILDNTIMLDESMMRELGDWTKSTTIALKLQASNAPEWLSNMYTKYKRTFRSATITMFLYGNLGTAVRNMVDSSTKGLNEVTQYNQDMFTYLKKYKDAVADVHEYSNIYREIEDEFGTVDRETVAKYFSGNTEGLDKFNIIYGYEHTCGGDSVLSELTLKETRAANVDYLQDGINIDRDIAEKVRDSFDKTYASRKYYGLTNAQLETHMVKIHDECMDTVRKNLKDEIAKGKLNAQDLEAISNKFWDYHPTVVSWGDKLSEFPILGFNKAQFNNAEVRARLAIYQTFIEGGATEAEAMKHVTATQFHYAGLGKVEDFMPFTQYKLYNALYWFDHANGRAMSTAWRMAQYNGDAAMTNEEIADLCSKYRQASYYIYDKGADEAYDRFFNDKIEPLGKGLTDIDSYLGVPREFGIGNLNLDGTHYLKLGNSFIEEVDMITSCMVSIPIFAQSVKDSFTGGDTENKIRRAYEALKFTPLYDSFYSPWKSYIDLIAYAYDNKEVIAQRKINKANIRTKTKEDIDINFRLTTEDIWNCCEAYLKDKSTRSEAVSGLSFVGAILSNMSGRWKNFNLNKGLLAALLTDPDAKEELFTYTRDLICDTAGMLIPSVVGTKVEKPYKYQYDYYKDNLTKVLVQNPAIYFDFIGRLERDMGFAPEDAKAILDSIYYRSPTGAVFWMGQDYMSKQDYFDVAVDLFSKGYSVEEITNLFREQKVPQTEMHKFLGLYQAVPDYIKYDKEKREELLAYYVAMGMNKTQAWARIINHNAIIIDGKLVELSNREAWEYNNNQRLTYLALNKGKGNAWTQEEWDAYWKNMPFNYPKGKWKETRQYLMRAGYTFDEACAMLLHGYMLDENGMLTDVPGKVRARVYSYNSSALRGAEWDAYWNTVPYYTKYEKGAFGRTMKALKKMGYSDEQARALIQQGLYANKDGTLMNVTGMERPVLGYKNFNAYYQTIPEYCRYEKGAFSRTYKALKALGFDYDTSLRLIQQGAYLMDMSMARATLQTLGARRNKDGSDIVVTDINTLIARYGGQVIIGADGKQYMLIDCSGLTRPRRTYSYSRRGGRGGRGGGSNYPRRSYNYMPRTYAPKYKIPNYKLRSPYVLQNNVSTFMGFTNFRGSNSLTKPYTTSGHVSTYSMQNFLNGASYGMRKTYKIDMRQYKTGALSIKSSYPTSYRNIAVAYRRNMYKDLYAKYGMSRMRMRANKQGYSNAAITRLRRNEIFNRERYAERRDLISKINSGRRRKASV